MAKIRVFFCDEFKTYPASSKETIHRLVYIGIVNYEKGEIGHENEEAVVEEAGNRPIFQAIVENLTEQGVTVVFA
ncbi:hypothetical protein [Paenibacillus ehimensis]|uniref:hypothetical protein n=1 Tax=Paenibacillus ehimensis TaxID=79264 RepID=UPI000FDA1896|nr:hypothetical protein [Paenibacillus ehimensis]